jgi:alpha-soluble NSF attachment protein
MPSKSPAQTLLEKAEKKANSSSGWFSSSSTKFEEAGDLYQQAANSFKLEKLFREAGDAFAKEAECREKCNEKNDAANAWWNAAKAYKRGYPDRALINCQRLISTKDCPPSSRRPSIVTNRHAFNAGWSLPSGC